MIYSCRLPVTLQLIGLKGGKMHKWECSVCGYVYDPADGDPEHGVALGTAFDHIADSWFCPNCGVGREFFKKAE